MSIIDAVRQKEQSELFRLVYGNPLCKSCECGAHVSVQMSVVSVTGNVVESADRISSNQVAGKQLNYYYISFKYLKVR